MISPFFISPLSGSAGRTAFTPLQLNPYLLLDATYPDFSTYVGTDVSRIGDQSNTGADFIQGTPAQRPVVDSTTAPTKITTVGANSETLVNTDATNIGAITALSSGLLTYINDGTALVHFGVGDISNNLDHVVFGITAGKAFIQIGAATNVIKSVTSPNVNDRIYWLSTGSSYKCYINGVEDSITVPTGSDDGKFFSQFPDSDLMGIATLPRLAQTYYNAVFKHVSIYPELTQTEITNLDNYLVARHNL